MHAPVVPVPDSYPVVSNTQTASPGLCRGTTLSRYAESLSTLLPIFPGSKQAQRTIFCLFSCCLRAANNIIVCRSVPCPKAVIRSLPVCQSLPVCIYASIMPIMPVSSCLVSCPAMLCEHVYNRSSCPAPFHADDDPQQKTPVAELRSGGPSTA